ncbi:MAG: cytochrome P450 [Myxococcota bacterium]
MALADTHPFDPGVLAEPHAFDRQLRAEAPVYRDPHTGLFLVASHAFVLEAVRDTETFSNRFAAAMGGGGGEEIDPELATLRAESHPAVDTMLTADPPEHKRFRGLVNKAFTPRRIQGIHQEMRKLCESFIDDLLPRGTCEALNDYGVRLPLTIIADQLGVPRQDLPSFKRWTDGFTAQLSGLAVGEDAIEAQRRILEFQRYFESRVEEAGRNPREDILSDLVRARLEGERPLDMAESLSILQQLLVAGNETTANAIAEGLLLLVRNPDVAARLRSDPSATPRFVEEVLRLASPTQNMWRRVKRDTVLGGVEIPEGSMVLLRYGAANRDPEVFPSPDAVDLDRDNHSAHLAFGHGIHFCLGAMLARKEMQVAFDVWLERVGHFDTAPDFTPRYRPSILLRGLEELPLTVAAA